MIQRISNLVLDGYDKIADVYSRMVWFYKCSVG